MFGACHPIIWVLGPLTSSPQGLLEGCGLDQADMPAADEEAPMRAELSSAEIQYYGSSFKIPCMLEV